MRGLSADKRAMSLRIRARLPHAAAIVLVALGATAALSYAAGQGIGTSSTEAASTTIAPTTVVVPDVVNQAFVFAKGTLEDAGLGWHVAGSVHGYPANTVVAQTPAAGTKLLDTGAPLVTLTLKRNPAYAQAGEAEDASPYQATPDHPADLASRPLPPQTTTTAPAATTTAPAATTPAPATTAPAATTTTAPKATPAPKAATPESRPPDFVVPGARKEPLDEIPLTERAAKLAAWLPGHAKPTNATVKYWLYQNEWIVTGAKLGWWHGADALRTLIAVDRHAQSQWGIGAKSAAAAAAALAYVEARTKK
jgi:PASTA domain-containing protein